MEILEIERLVELVQNSGVAELSLRQGTSRITIKTGGGTAVLGTALVHQPKDNLYDAEIDYSPVEIDTVDSELSGGEAAHLTISAPSVGVFKHVKPVVGLQASVRSGQVIGVIEAMKLYNDVVCTADGIVKDVLVDDGMPVEYDQPLYLIEPVL